MWPPNAQGPPPGVHPSADGLNVTSPYTIQVMLITSCVQLGISYSLVLNDSLQSSTTALGVCCRTPGFREGKLSGTVSNPQDHIPGISEKSRLIDLYVWRLSLVVVNCSVVCVFVISLHTVDFVVMQEWFQGFHEFLAADPSGLEGICSSGEVLFVPRGASHLRDCYRPGCFPGLGSDSCLRRLQCFATHCCHIS